MNTKARELGRQLCVELAHLDLGHIFAPRLLVVMAHADDETIAVGGRMECLQNAHFMLVTDGAPRQDPDGISQTVEERRQYAGVRRSELRTVLDHAGLPAHALIPVVVQGEPVSDQKARESMAGLAHEVTAHIQALNPDAVLTHPYEGGHPDHDACAFAVHLALKHCNQKIPILESPFYYRGEEGFTTGTFLGYDQGVQCELSTRQSENKKTRLALFSSQEKALTSFGIAREAYRVAPSYDFNKPPHPGKVMYEDFGWGYTGRQFCRLARKASLQFKNEIKSQRLT